MNHYRMILRIGFISLVLYLLLQHPFASQNHLREWYPISQWRLWSNVPNRMPLYHLEIVSYNGKTLSQPTNWKNIPSLARVAKQHDVAIILENLDPQRRINSNERKALQEQMEKRFFGSNNVQYRLIKQIIEPLRYYRIAQAEETIVIGEYSTLE